MIKSKWATQYTREQQEGKSNPKINMKNRKPLSKKKTKNKETK